MAHLVNISIAALHLSTDMEVIQKAGKYLLSVMDQILDYSKIEAAKLDLKDRSFSLRTDCIGFPLLEQAAEDKGLSFSISVADQIPDEFRGDVNQIRQVLNNLLTNAIQYTEKGSVELTFDLIEETEEFCSVAFSVNDIGVGIGEKELSSIFGRFAQGDQSAARQAGGSGLGLPIAQGIVNAMGGEISVKSFAGVGSEFSFTLDLRKTSSS